MLGTQPKEGKQAEIEPKEAISLLACPTFGRASRHLLQDHHRLVGDTGIWVNLLEDLVDVGRVGLCSLLLSLLLVTIGCGRGLLCRLAGLSSSGL